MFKKPLEKVSLDAKRQHCHLQLSCLVALPQPVINGKSVKILLLKLLGGILNASNYAWEKQEVLKGDHIYKYINIYIHMSFCPLAYALFN